MRTDSLGEAARYFSGQLLQIDPEFCINLRARTELCMECVAACPHEALTTTIDDLLLDNTRCVGCGSCVNPCPAGALGLSGFSPQRLLASIEAEQPLHLHCRSSRDGGGGVVIPCHSMVDSRLLLALAEKGASSIALHGLKGCEACDIGDATAAIADARADLQRLVDDGFVTLDTDPQVQQQGERVREDQPRLSRRNFLKIASAQSMVEGAGFFIAESEQENALQELAFFHGDGQPQRPAVMQQLLADAHAGIAWRADVELPWQVRTIEEGCTACMACGERCPTGALTADSSGGDRRIDWQMGRCTDCGLCSAVCPVDAISERTLIDADAFTAQPQTLLFRHWSRCQQCGDSFPPVTGVSLCPVCRNEQELDDEWMEMLQG